MVDHSQIRCFEDSNLLPSQLMIEECSNDELALDRLWWQAGRELLVRGKYYQSLSYFRKVLTKYGKNVDVCKDLILLYLSCNELFLAQSAVKYGYMVINSKNPWFHFYEGACYMAFHDDKQAEEQFELAVKLDPENEDRFRQIRTNWLEYIQQSGFDPNNEKVHANFTGFFTLVFGNADFKAVKSCDGSAEVAKRLAILSDREMNPVSDKDFAVLLWRIAAKIYHCYGIGEKYGLEYLNEALQYDPENVDILKDRAIAYYYPLRKIDLAIDDIITGLKIDGNHALMLTRKAMLLQHFGDFEKADKIFERAIKLSPDKKDTIVTRRQEMLKLLYRTDLLAKNWEPGDLVVALSGKDTSGHGDLSKKYI